jgi:hypothetical protein
MIGAKCDWVYQVPLSQNWPHRSRQAGYSKPFKSSLANQYKKKIRAAHAKEKQRI